MTVPQEAVDAAVKSVRAGYGAMADVLTGQIRYALEAAAPLIAAAERERCAQLAEREAELLWPAYQATLRDFAAKLRQEPS